MKKKVLALVVTLAMLASLLTMPAAAAGGKTFPDAVGHWAEDSILRWSRCGLVKGDELGNVNPNKPLRRCEMATILSDMLGLRTAAPISTFKDINGTEWYARAILRCAAAGIMEGDTNSMSNPEAYITREEAIAMFCRALGVPRDNDPDLSKFSDGDDVSGWAAPYMATLTELGILSGMGDGTIAPHNNINRAGAFTLMDKAISVYANAPGSYTSRNANGFVVINANTHTEGDVIVSGKATGVLVAVGATDTIRLRDMTTDNVLVNGKSDVVIAGKSAVDNLAANTEVTVTVENGASVDNLDVNAEKIIVANAGTVKNLNCDTVSTVTNTGKVTELVADAAVSITNTGTVDKLVANAPITVDNTKGTVKDAEINIGGVVMDGPPQQMTLASGVARPSNSSGRPISATGTVSSSSGSSGGGGGGGSRPTTTVPATGIKLNKTATTLTEGSSEKLTATLLPSNAKSTTVTWSSDAESVATVDQKGNVKAVSEGTATITASISVTVTVPDPSPSPSDEPSESPSPSTEPSESPDPSTEPSESPDPSTEPSESPDPSTEPSENPDPSPEPSEGEEGTGEEELTNLPPAAPAAVRAGVPVTQAETTTVYTATCVVTVTAKTVAVTSVTLDKTALTLTEGESDTLTATVNPTDATNPDVTWKSSNESVATVVNGTVTAVSEGTATITVTTVDGGKTATCAVTVNAKGEVPGPDTPKTPEIKLDQTTLNLKMGETETGTLTPTMKNVPEGTAVNWTSNNEGVATVAGGTVTAVSDGTAIITAKITVDGTEYSATCTVTVAPAGAPVVTPSVTSVTVTPKTASIEVDSTQQLTVTVAVEGGAAQTVNWTSDNEAVATVDTNGLVTAVTAGKATITATSTVDGTKTDTCEVTVTEKTPVTIAVTGVSLNETTLTANVGDTLAQLVATIAPEDATNKTVTWTSSDEDVVTVDSEGNLTIKGTGEATITVTTEDGSHTATCMVTVSPVNTEEGEGGEGETTDPECGETSITPPESSGTEGEEENGGEENEAAE